MIASALSFLEAKVIILSDKCYRFAFLRYDVKRENIECACS